MEAILLKCKKCGRVYGITNMKPRDLHKCGCGAMLSMKYNCIGSCDDVEDPNTPYENEQTIKHFGNGSSICKDKLHKKILIDVETGSGFKQLMKDIDKVERFLNWRRL